MPFTQVLMSYGWVGVVAAMLVSAVLNYYKNSEKVRGTREEKITTDLDKKDNELDALNVVIRDKIEQLHKERLVESMQLQEERLKESKQVAADMMGHHERLMKIVIANTTAIESLNYNAKTLTDTTRLIEELSRRIGRT